MKKVVILGGGVVGVATAYYLGQAGCQVTLIDRQPKAANETSLGNAGLVSPGDATAWASPGALKNFVQSLYRPDMGIKIRPSRVALDWRFWAWSLQFLTQCTTAKAQANTRRKLRLAFYAREQINAISAATGVRYDERRSGIVYFFRSAQSLEAGVQHMAFLAAQGLTTRVLNRDELAAVEPGLAGVKHELAGGIHVQTDQTGDSHQFGAGLLQWCVEHQGLQVRMNTTMQALQTDGSRITGVQTSAGLVQADAYVLAAGSDSTLLAATAGLYLSVYPVKGYSMTIPIAEGEGGPTMGGVDDDRLVAYSRLGNRLRLAASAEFTGFDRTHQPQDFSRMIQAGRALFPEISALQDAQETAHDPITYWAGLRPMTPSSVPMLGQAKFDNLYLNTGHGHVGWTLCAGSGKVVADLLTGKQPEIDTEGLLYRPGRR
jgi:D-amino-acid dehydrogenase